MRVARNTDERTLQASILPCFMPCGHSLTTLSITTPHAQDPYLLWASIANSFIVDYLVRGKVLINLDFWLMSQLPMPRLSPENGVGRELVVLAARLNCVIPELAELWEEVVKHYPNELHPQWQLPAADLPTCQSAKLPVIDPFERQFLRARIDALVADVYGLSVEEFAYILSTFPLLDRDQPALPLSRVPRPASPVPDATEPKSTITRDLALCAYMLHKGWRPSPFGEAHPEFHRWLCEKLGVARNIAPSDSSPQIPSDLAQWFAQNVPEAQIPEMGEICDLEERLYVALKQLKAIAYIPTQREREEESEEVEGESETEEGE